MYLTNLHIYSALRKYSMFYVAALLNCFKLLFVPHINLHSIHYNDKAKTELSQLFTFIKNKNLK